MADLILFIHGLGCSGDAFAEARNHPRLGAIPQWCPDLLGFGAAPKPADASYDLQQQAQRLAVELRDRAFDRLHLVGHSLGGAVMLLLPEDILARTATLISVEGNLIGEDCGLVSRKVAGSHYDSFVNDIFPRMRDHLDSLGIRGLHLGATTPLVFYRSCLSLVHWSDSSELLWRFLAFPRRKAYLHGGRSRHLPILRRLPYDLLVEVPDSGHFLMHDNPGVFYDRVADLILGDG